MNEEGVNGWREQKEKALVAHSINFSLRLDSLQSVFVVVGETFPQSAGKVEQKKREECEKENSAKVTSFYLTCGTMWLMYVMRNIGQRVGKIFGKRIKILSHFNHIKPLLHP